MGLHIRAIREARGLSQRQLATRTGMNAPLVCKLENNTAYKYTVTLSQLETIAEALQVSVALLIQKEEPDLTQLPPFQSPVGV